jgi:hypothetical protein
MCRKLRFCQSFRFRPVDHQDDQLHQDDHTFSCILVAVRCSRKALQGEKRHRMLASWGDSWWGLGRWDLPPSTPRFTYRIRGRFRGVPAALHNSSGPPSGVSVAAIEQSTESKPPVSQALERTFFMIMINELGDH